jgi:uncharacterized membrane protein YhaH (DUF805 family)
MRDGIFPTEPAPTRVENPKTITAFLFSYHGRISRKDYWLKGVLGFGVVALVVMLSALYRDVAAAIAADQEPRPGLAFWTVYLILLYPALAIQAKRWHDRGRTAWWVMVGLIPFVGPIWSFFELGCLPGEREDNEFGPDPLAGR